MRWSQTSLKSLDRLKTPSLKELLALKYFCLQLPPWQQDSKALFSPLQNTKQNFFSGGKLLVPFCRNLHHKVLAAKKAEWADWGRSCLFRTFPAGYQPRFRTSRCVVFLLQNCCSLQSSLLKDPKEICNVFIKLVVNCCYSRGSLWAITACSEERQEGST